MLKLKLQYFGHLMRSVDSLEKTLMLGGIGQQQMERQVGTGYPEPGSAGSDMALEVAGGACR